MDNELKKLDDIARIAMQYYEQENFSPSQEEFELWIESLREPMKSGFRKKGLSASKGVLNFRRFILELNDKGMDEFMKARLSVEDYSFWREAGRG